MIEQKYIGVLQQSKESILHSIKELNQTLKTNEQKTIADSLTNVLSSIATFDEDFIRNSMGLYASNTILQDSIDKIITKIKQTKEASKELPNITKPIKPKEEQPPAATLRVSSEIVRSSSSKEKEPKIGLDGNSGKKDGSSGLFGVFGKILGGGSKAQKPKAYQMILPQKESKAVYDPVKKKWIFQGEEEQPQKQIPKPPPRKQPQLQKSQTSSEQSISKQLKKSVSQVDQMTAPPSFKRRGQTKSTGGTKRIIIKEEVIPTTLVEEETNPLDSLMNMIEKEFFKLQEELQSLEQGWRGKIEREVKKKEMENERKLKELLGENMSKGKKELNEKESKYVDELNAKIKEFNETSATLMDEYLNLRDDNLTVNEFDAELSQKLMKIARDNTIISHKLSNESKLRQVPISGQQPISREERFKDVQQLSINLENQLEQLRKQGQEKENKIRQLQQKLASFLEQGQMGQKQIRQSHQIQELAKSSEQFKQLQKKIAFQSQTINELKEKVRSLQKVSEQNTKMKHQIEIKEGQISQMILKLQNSQLAARLLEEEKITQEQNCVNSEKRIAQLTELIYEEKLSKEELVEVRIKLQAQNEELAKNNEQLSRTVQGLRSEAIRFQQERKSFQLHTRQQEIIHQETMKSNLQQLEAFAQSIAEQSLLLVSIQNKQLELRAYSDRSSENSSSKKSEPQHQQLYPQSEQLKSNSFLNISDILTQMTKQYIEKITEMKYQLNQLEQNNKSLNKVITKERQRFASEIQSLKKSLNTSQTLNQGYKKSRKQLQEKISSLQTQGQKLKKKLQLMKKQQLTNKQLVQQALYEKHNHTHELSILQNNNQQLQGRIEDLEEELLSKEGEVEELKYQIQEMRAELDDKEDVIRDKENVINRMRAKIDEENEVMNEKMERKENEYKNLLRGKDKQLQGAKKEIQALLQKEEKLYRESKSTKQSLTTKLHQSQTSRKQLSKQLKSAQSQINELQQSLSSSHKQLQKLKHSNKQLSSQLQQSLSSTHQQKLSLQQMKSELHSIRQENAQQILVIEQINTEKEQLQGHVANLQHQLSSVNEELRLNKEEQNELHERVQQYVEYSQRLKGEVDLLERQKQQLLQDYKSVSIQEFSKITSQKQQLQNHLQSTINMYSEIQREFTVMKQEMDQKILYLTQQLESSFNSGQQLSRQLGAYSQLVTRMGEKIEQLEGELQVNKSNYDDRSSQVKIRELEEKHEQELTELLESLDAKEKEIQEVSVQLETMKQQISSLTHDNDELRKQLQHKDKSINTLTQQNIYLSQQLQQLTHQLANQNTKLLPEQGINQLTQLQASLNQLHSQHEQLTKNYSQLYAIYEESQVSIEELNNKVQTLDEALGKNTQLEQTNNELLLMVETLEKENQNKAGEINQLEARVKQLESSVYSLKENNQLLEAKLQQSKTSTFPAPNTNQNDQLNNIIMELSQRLQAAQKDNSRLVQQLEFIKVQLNQQNQFTSLLKGKSAQTDLAIETLTHTNQYNLQLLKQKDETIAIKDSIISELSASLQSKQEQLRRAIEEKLMLSSRADSMESSYNNNSINKNESMTQTRNSTEPRHDNLSQIEELLQSLNQELQEKKIKQQELLEIITQQQVQIAILKQKNKQLLAKSPQTDIPKSSYLIDQQRKVELKSQKQEQESHELYMVIEEMQKQLEDKNQQIQELKQIVDNLDSSFNNNNNNESTNRLNNQQTSPLNNTHKKQRNQNGNEEQIFTQVSDNLSRLAEELKEKENQIENQKMYAQILKDKEEQQMVTITQLQKVNAQLEMRVKSLEEKLLSFSNKQGQQNETQSKIQQLQTLLSNMQEEISSKEEELLKRANQIHRLKQLQVENNDQITKLKQENQRLEASVKEFEEMVRAASNQLNEVRNQKEQLQQRFKKQEEQLLTLKTTSKPVQSSSPQLSIPASTKQHEQQVKSLKQLIQKLQSQLKKQKELVQSKEDQIQQMTELINSQAADIQRLEDKIKLLDQELVETAQKYQEKLKTEVVNRELVQVKEKVQQVEENIAQNEAKENISKNDELVSVKAELQQVYQELRNKKIQVDQLRNNLFDVNKVFTERQAKYEQKIKSLQTELHKYDKTKDAFAKYENSIKELEMEVTNLSSEKAEFLRVIDNLERQLLQAERKLGSNSFNVKEAEKNTNLKATTQKKQPASDNKLRSTKSEIIQPATEVKPTGFFGSISSLFMTPIQTERMVKKIVNK